jgi:hypothetical protein
MYRKTVLSDEITKPRYVEENNSDFGIASFSLDHLKIYSLFLEEIKNFYDVLY